MKLNELKMSLNEPTMKLNEPKWVTHVNATSFESEINPHRLA